MPRLTPPGPQGAAARMTALLSEAIGVPAEAMTSWCASPGGGPGMVEVRWDGRALVPAATFYAFLREAHAGANSESTDPESPAREVHS